MYSFIFGAFLVLNFLSRSFAFPDYSEFEDDFQRQFFLEDVEDSKPTIAAKEPWKNDEEPGNNFTTNEIPATTLSSMAEGTGRPIQPEEETKTTENVNTGSSYNFFPITPPSPEVSSKKTLLDQLPKIHANAYRNFHDSFHNSETEANAPPTRREVNNWHVSDEFLEPDNVPWNYDSYYPRDSKYTQGEYFDYPNAPIELFPQPKNGSFGVLPSVIQDGPLRADLPQYFQKNYYYNYYPAGNSRKYYNSQTWTGEGEIPEENSKLRAPFARRRFIKKSACKQYLEFLKYAFEKLDETPEYDYVDDYNDDKSQKNEKPGSNPRLFTTHLAGPTLYIDNSGKVSQVNSKGASVQEVEGIPAAPRVVISTESFPAKLWPTSSGFIPEKRVTWAPQTTTTEHPWKTSTATTPTDSTKAHFHHETLSPRINTDNVEHTHWKQGFSETTVRLDTNHQTDFDDYDYNEIKTTVSTQWIPPKDFNQKLGSGLERTTQKTTANEISSSTNVKIGLPPNDWFTHGPSTPATIISEDLKKEDVDCNDKMLPCPDTVNVTYPLNGYCNRYISCESGKAIRRICPEGLHFNIITKSCDLPHNSFCTYACPEPSGYYGIPGDCGGYFVCKNSIAEYRMCPPRMHWDYRKKLCTFSELSSCSMKCSIPNEVKPYEGDCKAYVICLTGVPFYHKCPPNTKFDSKLLTCVSGHLSKCEDDPRLLTKTLNPNYLCKDFQARLGSEVWCSYFESFGKKSEERPAK